ncbi:MAG TPA: hypothetical protein ENL27_02620 [Candidatus Parcubacteria bacterium]|nr:hypothetical protein [Candidatus Parcubacteria bacterium]
MVAESQGTVIPSAENLRKMVDDKRNNRRKELKEATSFVMKFMGDFICRRMDEVIEGEEGAMYTLSSDDVKRACEVKGKPLLAPTTLEEFRTVISIITDTLSDNGYETRIIVGFESEKVLKAEISISVKLPEEKGER